jgi:hypothetical protein
MLYYELYKKVKFLTKTIPIHVYSFFYCSVKYNTISIEISHEYSGHIYVFME